MGIKKEKIEKIVNGKKHVIYPEETKQQIVKELENGILSVKEAMRIYEIHRAGTIQTWLKKYSEKYREEYMRVTYSRADCRQIVFKIESGILSIEVAASRYRVEEDTIKDWIKLYSCQPVQTTPMQENKALLPAESDQSQELQKINHALKLKVEGLETMIDIAEKELNIAIRKKSGTKQ